MAAHFARPATLPHSAATIHGSASGPPEHRETDSAHPRGPPSVRPKGRALGSGAETKAGQSLRGQVRPEGQEGHLTGDVKAKWEGGPHTADSRATLP